MAIKKKAKIEAYKIAEMGFGTVFYKTKNASGKSIYGKGKTSFLDGKYKEKSPTQMFNFEKYMMSKPDSPTIIMNESDNDDNADNLFGVNTSTRLKEELQKVANESVVEDTNNFSTNSHKYSDGKSDSSDNTIAHDLSDIDDFEIIFDDSDPTLEDSSVDGGAITESYETPAIKHNDKK